MEYGLVIGVIAFIALAALYGYVRGMVKIVLSLVAMIVTLILATMLTVPVGAMVKEVTPIYDNMYETVYETIEEYSVVDMESLDRLNLPEQLVDRIAEEGAKTVDEFRVYVATEITETAFDAGVFLVLVVVLYILVKIAISVLDIVAKLPLLKEVNKLAGFLIGLVYGLFVIWTACLILTAFSSQPWAKDIFEAINNNAFLSFVYNNNLITWIVTKVL